MATEREQIEQVFGLTGGELSDTPWKYEKEGEAKSFDYWYEGAPESELPRGEYRTVVECTLFASLPERVEFAWRLVATFRSSGERECFAFGQVVTEADSTDGKCYDCEEPIGEAHGTIYLGDGWVEGVYALDTRPIVALDRNNAGERFIGCTDLDEQGVPMRAYVLSMQAEGMANSVFERMFRDMARLMGDNIQT